MAPRNDIAVYAPFAFYFYEDRATHRDRVPHGGGGAELQSTLLAQALAQNGLQVAHIIYRREHPTDVPVPSLELIDREPWAGRRGLPGKVSEALRVWRSLTDADARLYVFRGGGAHLMIGAAFCLLRRRRLVVSASSDLDFIFDRPDRSRWGQALYRAALRRAQCVVVQTTQQLELARKGLGAGARVELIPSFAQPSLPRPRRRSPRRSCGRRAWSSTSSRCDTSIWLERFPRPISGWWRHGRPTPRKGSSSS